MDAGLFERSLLHPPKLSTVLRELHPQAADFFKDIYSLEFLGLPAEHDEADLHRSLLRNLGRFITELGRDFCARPKITQAILVPICHLTALRWPHTLRTTIPAKPLRKHAQTGGLLFSGRKCFDS